MSDLKKILDEGKMLQSEQHIPAQRRSLPSLWPWVAVALILVLISVGIELFWPARVQGPLPLCDNGGQKEVSCQKPLPSASMHSEN